jgi:hypothetical protein
MSEPEPGATPPAEARSEAEDQREDATVAARLAVLAELAREAQELNMGYE